MPTPQEIAQRANNGRGLSGYSYSVLNGNVVTSGGTIISCWSGDDKNVIFMEKLMKLTKEYIKTHSIEETKNIMRIVYEKCLKTNKNLSSLTSILKELSLNNYIKYL